MLVRILIEFRVGRELENSYAAIRELVTVVHELSTGMASTHEELATVLSTLRRMTPLDSLSQFVLVDPTNSSGSQTQSEASLTVLENAYSVLRDIQPSSAASAARSKLSALTALSASIPSLAKFCVQQHEQVDSMRNSLEKQEGFLKMQYDQASTRVRELAEENQKLSQDNESAISAAQYGVQQAQALFSRASLEYGAKLTRAHGQLELLQEQLSRLQFELSNLRALRSELDRLESVNINTDAPPNLIVDEIVNAIESADTREYADLLRLGEAAGLDILERDGLAESLDKLCTKVKALKDNADSPAPESLRSTQADVVGVPGSVIPNSDIMQPLSDIPLVVNPLSHSPILPFHVEGQITSLRDMLTSQSPPGYTSDPDGDNGMLVPPSTSIQYEDDLFSPRSQAQLTDSSEEEERFQGDSDLYPCPVKVKPGPTGMCPTEFETEQVSLCSKWCLSIHLIRSTFQELLNHLHQVHLFVT